MAPEPENESQPQSGGIPLKSSKQPGSAIRMTSSKSPDETNTNQPQEMSEEEKNTDNLPQEEKKTPVLKPKSPENKPGGLPSLKNMKTKKPLEPKAPEGNEADSGSKDTSKLENKNPAEPKPTTSEKTEGDKKTSAESEDATSAASLSSDSDDSAEDKKPASSSAALPPKQGDRPKLTPKIPVKPTADEKTDSQPEEPKKPQAGSGNPTSPARPTPPGQGAKTPPPKPHVVRPGSASAKSHPTQGGSAVAVDTQKKRSSGVSPVGLALDVLASVGALAVGYLIVTDLLKIL